VYLPQALNGTGTSDDYIGTLPSSKIKGGTETILVVEDEVGVRQLAVGSLIKYGYKVLDAPDGPTALDIWRQNADSIHLLLTDVVLPNGMNGLELAECMRKDKPLLKVVYSSGYGTENIMGDQELVAGVNFLAKPFYASKLAQIVRRSLDDATA
jgi:CheY-like chemotaxis protein